MTLFEPRPPAYDYRVENWCPRRDNTWGGRGFNIDLSAEFARRCKAQKLHDEVRTHLVKECRRDVVAIMGKDLPLFPCRLNFWEETCLLTNIDVPGNACGLDMGYSDFGALDDTDRDSFRWRGVQYLPHNVDTIFQATALLGGWLRWYSLADIAIERSKKLFAASFEDSQPVAQVQASKERI